MTRIGLIGDRDESVAAHQAIPIAVELAARTLGLAVNLEWLPTDRIESDRDLAGFDGLWCVPASPYRSMDGALRGIRYARETPLPFLGTCGGFQHGVIEYARNVLGWHDAEHAETTPDAAQTVIAPLECALVEATGTVCFTPGSRLFAAYGQDRSDEGYRCSYGIDPRFQEELVTGDLRVAARDPEGEIRGLELTGHPFFVLTLFQPERAALRGVLPPIVSAFVAACHAGSGGARR